MTDLQLQRYRLFFEPINIINVGKTVSLTITGNSKTYHLHPDIGPMVSNILPWCRTCPDDCSLLGSSEVRCSGSPRQADPGATSGTILDGEIHIFIGELTIPAIENHDTP